MIAILNKLISKGSIAKHDYDQIAEYLVNTGGDLDFLIKSTRERVSKEAREALTESIEDIEV